MRFVEDSWNALKSGNAKKDEFWAAVLILVVLVVILLCCCVGCFKVRRYCTHQKLSKELNGKLEGDILWDGRGDTRSTDVRVQVNRVTKHGDNRGSEASYSPSVGGSEVGYRAHAFQGNQSAQVFSPYDSYTDRSLLQRQQTQDSTHQRAHLSPGPEDGYRYNGLEVQNPYGGHRHVEADKFVSSATGASRVEAPTSPSTYSHAGSMASGAAPTAEVLRSPRAASPSGRSSSTRRRPEQRIQEPLMVSPRKHQLRTQESTASFAASDARPRLGGDVQLPPRGPSSRAPSSRDRPRTNPAAYVSLVTPALDNFGASNVSVSQGFQLETELLSAADGQDQISRNSSLRSMPSVDDTAGGRQARLPVRLPSSGRDRASPDLDATRVPQVNVPVVGKLTLSQHLGLASVQHAHPQVVERSAATAESLASQLWDAGIRYWLLQRRSTGQYAIIRRLHNLSSPFIKETADIDSAGGNGAVRQHALLDQAITVQGLEEVLYVDLAMQSGVLLEVLIGGVAGWVQVTLSEGSVVALPYASTYRLRMPGRGCIGLVRARME